MGQAKPFAGQRLSVLMVGHPTTDAVRKALPDFTAATGIDVDLEVVPEADSVPKMMLEFSAGSGRYDVVEANSIHVKGFVGADYIVPLDELAAKYGEFYDKTDFVPGYLTPNVVDGKLYGSRCLAKVRS
ncbi:extracellular solute-binding protein [Ensifer sp. NM-2]|uniref:extracellular solute-binding protein n=1 Tax=Ensifer sp. NM-2 TaxID=2109730 RepID=UPI00211009E5|nr:extracellular solute-binding protein [Ensifer sp. NM-2]